MNTITTAALDDEGNAASGTANATVTYTNVTPAIAVVKTASPTSVPPTGGNVTYTYQVTNTSAAGAFDPLHAPDPYWGRSWAICEKYYMHTIRSLFACSTPHILYYILWRMTSLVFP